MEYPFNVKESTRPTCKFELSADDEVIEGKIIQKMA